ncbi:MAG TPA: MBL fold metallo-hydrolase [Chitinophagaceae bacterium]|jgi:phosphoribosyl 1,2-cyclic phosphodiesterase|nr:MBL fold metallo-hydrolase [Chitinophagaceae bacterium]
MSLFITSLNSGSNGNCYYIGNSVEAVLIDAGICCREIEKRMKRLGLSIGKVKAVFVSHEHTDHIRGLPIFTKKHKIPVYITADTLKFGRLKLEKKLIRSFSAHQPVTIGDLLITPFPKLHDASDPYSFIVDCKKISVGVFTDIGYPCEHVIKHFRNCHAAFLETNYDEQMLEQGNYPYHLKKRIRGGMGHLSNNQALEIFIKHKPAFMSHLILSHLSENNNRPELVQELFNNHAGNVKMTVASRFCETAVFQIDRSNNQEETLNRSVSFSQLSFSFV